MKKSVYISVMGTLGSGKTTAARLIADHLGFDLIEENFGDNKFLPRFYKDMRRWAFHSQTFYMIEKISQLFVIPSKLEANSVVQDTPIQQDVYSYAKAQHVFGNMDDAEWELFLKMYHSFESHVPKADYIIYLKTSLSVIKERIRLRKRDYEQAIPDDYLELLQKLNEEWLQKEMSINKIIMIHTDSLNLVDSSEDIQEFIKTVRKVVG